MRKTSSSYMFLLGWLIRLFALAWIISASLKYQWIRPLIGESRCAVEYLVSVLGGVAKPPFTFPVRQLGEIGFEWGLVTGVVAGYFLLRKVWPRSLARLARWIGRHYYLLILIVFLLGTALRILWLDHANPKESSDAIDYRRLGMKLARNQLYESAKMPSWRPAGYPLLLSLAYRTGCDRVTGARIVDTLTTLLLPIVLGFLVYTISGRIAAFCAYVIAMLSPIMVCHSGNSLTEAPYALFMLTGITLIFWAGRSNKRFTIRCLNRLGAGACLGYAALIRAPGLIALVLGVLYSFRNRDKYRLAAPALVLLAGAIVLTPWSIRNYRIHHRFCLISTNAGSIFYAANKITEPWQAGAYNMDTQLEIKLREPNDVLRTQLGFRLGLEYILAHKTLTLRSIPWRFFRFFNGFNYAGHGGWALSQRPLPWWLPEALFAGFLLLPVFMIIRGNSIASAIRGRNELKLIGVLYLGGFFTHLWFEMGSRMHFPYAWLLFILLICSFEWNDQPA